MQLNGGGGGLVKSNLRMIPTAKVILNGTS